MRPRRSGRCASSGPKAAKSSRWPGCAAGRLLVNFWATWCPPCVEELPLLDRFASATTATRAPWRVVGLAVDRPEPVRSFLAAHPVRYPVGLAGLDGVALARSLGNASGGLPFTLAFARDGRAVARHLGALTPQLLDAWVAAAA